MLYRAPELFNADVGTTVDERTDIWVSSGIKIHVLFIIMSLFYF